VKTRIPEEEFVLRVRQDFLQNRGDAMGLNFGAAGEVSEELPFMARQAGPRSLDSGVSRLAMKLPYRLLVVVARWSQGAGSVDGKTLPAEGVDDP
jgi:hypothetical protein